MRRGLPCYEWPPPPPPRESLPAIIRAFSARNGAGEERRESRTRPTLLSVRVESKLASLAVVGTRVEIITCSLNRPGLAPRLGTSTFNTLSNLSAGIPFIAITSRRCIDNGIFSPSVKP